jgi:hypothetical protein
VADASGSAARAGVAKAPAASAAEPLSTWRRVNDVMVMVVLLDLGIVIAKAP